MVATLYISSNVKQYEEARKHHCLYGNELFLYSTRTCTMCTCRVLPEQLIRCSYSNKKLSWWWWWGSACIKSLTQVAMNYLIQLVLCTRCHLRDSSVIGSFDSDFQKQCLDGHHCPCLLLLKTMFAFHCKEYLLRIRKLHPRQY